MRAPGPGGGRGPRPGLPGGGPRWAAAPDPGPRARARPSRRPREGRRGGRAGEEGRRGSPGGSEPRGGRAGGQRRGRQGAPRPPKEESGSHLLPRTRGEAAAAGGAPAPARLPPGSRAPASLRARCCSRPPKRSPGPGRAGGELGAGRARRARGGRGRGRDPLQERGDARGASQGRPQSYLGCLWRVRVPGVGTPTALPAERVPPGGASAGALDSDGGRGVSETFPHLSSHC